MLKLGKAPLLLENNAVELNNYGMIALSYAS